MWPATTMKMCSHVEKSGVWPCCCLINSHICNSSAHLEDLEASLWIYRLWPAHIQWSALGINRERSLSSISSSMRHPADTSMHYKAWLSQLSLPAVRKRRSIDLNWLTGWFQELCMGFMVPWWAKKTHQQQQKKINTSQYHRPLGSNIICWKPI